MKYRFLDSAILGEKRQSDTDQFYHIVGGGIAGLMLAYFLQKKGIDCRIYEKTKRTGGLLQTQNTTFGLAEGAANGVRWSKDFEEMATDLGLKLIAPKASARKRFIVRNGELRQFPLGFGESFLLFKKLFTTKPIELKTVKDFGNKYLGVNTNKQLLAPGLSGIYGADVSELSFPAVFGDFAKRQIQADSLGWDLLKSALLGQKKPKAPAHLKGGTLSFEGGMQALVDALTSRLKDKIVYDFDALELQKTVKNEAIVLCVPAYAAADFFPDHPLQKHLNAVTYLPMLTATIFFKKQDLAKFKAGFGCLIPRQEGFTTLGVLLNSCIFNQRVTHQDLVSMTWITRDFKGDLLGKSDGEIIELLTKDVARLFGLHAAPQGHYLYRWPKGIPLYSPELYESWFEIDELLKKDFKNIRLFGNYTGKIAIRTMCEAAARW